MGQPSWIEPELATLTRERFSDPAWISERKLDGERCLAFASGGTVRLLTRNHKDVTSNYPELAAVLAAQPNDDFIIDGEIVAFEASQTSFARLQQRMGVSDPPPALRRQVPVYYYVFDVMYAAGHDIRHLPLADRKGVLRSLLDAGGPLRFSAHRSGQAEAHWREACSRGWEGVIAKRADAPYRPGRCRDWLKFKCENSQEFVVGGYTDARGGRVGFGALLLGYYDADGRLGYAGKVGTGFDVRTLRSLLTVLRAIESPQSPFERGEPSATGVHWVRPRLVAQVGFAEWTTAGQLRHPRFVGLRDDKAPADVVREYPARG